MFLNFIDWNSCIQERGTCIANILEANAYEYAQKVWEHKEEWKEKSVAKKMMEWMVFHDSNVKTYHESLEKEASNVATSKSRIQEKLK